MPNLFPNPGWDCWLRLLADPLLIPFNCLDLRKGIPSICSLLRELPNSVNFKRGAQSDSSGLNKTSQSDRYPSGRLLHKEISCSNQFRLYFLSAAKYYSKRTRVTVLIQIYTYQNVGKPMQRALEAISSDHFGSWYTPAKALQVTNSNQSFKNQL